MIRKYAYLLPLLGLAIVVGAEIYLRVQYGTIAKSVAFMVWLVMSSLAVGAIPRQARTPQIQLVCSIIGWPMFLTFCALISLGVWAMVDLNEPLYMLLIGFLWVLAYLTWKVFIDPTVKSRNQK